MVTLCWTGSLFFALDASPYRYLWRWRVHNSDHVNLGCTSAVNFMSISSPFFNAPPKMFEDFLPWSMMVVWRIFEQLSTIIEWPFDLNQTTVRLASDVWRMDCRWLSNSRLIIRQAFEALEEDSGSWTGFNILLIFYLACTVQAAALQTGGGVASMAAPNQPMALADAWTEGGRREAASSAKTLYPSKNLYITKHLITKTWYQKTL